MSTANGHQVAADVLTDVSWHVPLLTPTAARLRASESDVRGEVNRAHIRLTIARKYPAIAAMFDEIEAEVTARLITDGLIRP